MGTLFCVVNGIYYDSWIAVSHNDHKQCIVFCLQMSIILEFSLSLNPSKRINKTANLL